MENLDTGYSGNFSSYGIDARKVFSGSRGDRGTLLIQAYGFHRSGNRKMPITNIMYRNVNFNYTELFQGRFNIRVGHFEIPFGLEQIVNTNGTLLNYSNKQNLGLKADWGVSLNGSLAGFEYEIASMQGSGNDWDTNSETYLYAGRIGSPRNRDFVVGLSSFSGHIIIPGPDKRNLLDRSRVGVDITWNGTPFIAMAEISIGSDDGRQVSNQLLELDWLSTYEEWLIYLQYTHNSQENSTFMRSKGARTVLGTRYEPDRNWQFDAQYSKYSRSNRVHMKELSIQMRYRFNL